jgi:hypothetical protein
LWDEVIAQFSRCFSASILYAQDNRDEALDYVLSYGRELGRSRADKIVGMYVIDYNVDIGVRGARAVRLSLKLVREKGCITSNVEPELVKRAVITGQANNENAPVLAFVSQRLVQLRRRSPQSPASPSAYLQTRLESCTAHGQSRTALSP